jgi:fumarate hydratase class II
MAGSPGQLQLNVFKPVIILNLLNSLQLLGDACLSFRVNFIAGWTWADRGLPSSKINR